MSKNNAYITGNLINYLYHQRYEKVIGIDLSRQTNATISEPIVFTEKLREKYVSLIMFFIIK